MSRTDKDAPYRVHLARSGQERHDHRLGVCDFEPREREWQGRWSERTRRQTCGLEIPGRYFHLLTYYPRTKLYAFWQSELNDEDNARVRQHLGEVKKLHRAGEDMDDIDVPNYQHRHSAAWEVW